MHFESIKASSISYNVETIYTTFQKMTALLKSFLTIIFIVNTNNKARHSLVRSFACTHIRTCSQTFTPTGPLRQPPPPPLPPLMRSLLVLRELHLLAIALATLVVHCPWLRLDVWFPSAVVSRWLYPQFLNHSLVPLLGLVPLESPPGTGDLLPKIRQNKPSLHNIIT